MRRRRAAPHLAIKWWRAFAAIWNSVGIVMCDRALTACRATKPWCATCLNYGPALRPRQLAPDGPMFVFCAICDERDGAVNPTGPTSQRGRPSVHCWERARYWPLDETKRDLSFRILRAISRFDWLTTTELREVMGVPGLEDVTANNTFSKRISVLARDGFLRRRSIMEQPEYQITKLGRARIASWINASVEAKASIAA